jgi:hypothetical protein
MIASRSLKIYGNPSSLENNGLNVNSAGQLVETGASQLFDAREGPEVKCNFTSRGIVLPYAVTSATIEEKLHHVAHVAKRAF